MQCFCCYPDRYERQLDFATLKQFTGDVGEILVIFGHIIYNVCVCVCVCENKCLFVVSTVYEAIATALKSQN